MSGAVKIVIGVAAVLAAFPTGGITLTAFSIAGSAFAPAVLGAGISLLATTAFGAIGRRGGPPQQRLQGNIRGSAETHLIVFGERRVGGLLFNGGTSGSTGQDWTVLLAHCVTHAGGCEGLQGAYFDDRYVPLAQLGALDGSTDVSATDLNGLVNIAFYRGTDAQVADSAAVAAGIATSTDVARRVCYSRVRYRRPGDDAAFQRAFPSGLQTQFNVILRGWRCYDPRLDSTNGGTGSHRVATPASWAWTQNPALCLATYLITPRLDGGCGLPESLLTWSQIAAAANICDELITTPAGNIARYRCDIVLDTRDGFEGNIGKLLETMAGSITGPIGGKLQITAGAYRSPTVTITEQWLAGPVNDRPYQPIDTLPNTIIGGYFDGGPVTSGGNNWKQVDTPPFSVGAAVASDGTREPVLVTWEGVTHPYRAQYLNHVALKKARRQRTLELPCNFFAYDVTPGETVAVSLAELGLSNAPFTVTEWRSESGVPILRLRETAASDYTPEAFTVPTLSGTVTTVTETLGTPQLLMANGIIDGISLTWQSPAGNMLADPLIAVYVVQRSPTTAGTWTEITRLPGFAFLDNTVVAGVTYDYRILAANRLGQTGSPSAVTTATAGSVSGSVSPGVLNPSFELGDRDWSKGAGWVIERMRARNPGNWSARHSGGVGSQIISNGFFDVDAGRAVSAEAWIRFDGSAGGDQARVQVLFYNSAGTLLSTVNGALRIPLTTGTNYQPSRVMGAVAPAGADYARIAILGSGTCNVDTISGSVLGAAIAGVNVLSSAETLLMDGDIITAIGTSNDTANVGGTAAATVRSNAANGNALTVVASGIRVGDNRNLPPVRITGVGSRWNGNVSYSYNAASPAVVTFTAPAQVLYGGDWSSTFSAVTATTTQARGTTQLYYLYYDSATVYAGGSLSLQFTTDPLDLVRGDNRVHIGNVNVVIPASGSGGQPGTPGGGGVIP